MKIYIPEQVEIALNTLNDWGFDAYVVGGCVRDSILGLKPKDWDITTSALPLNIIECFENYKVIKTGLKHGTITVIINNLQLEITTYRIDGEYSDNRRPDIVQFINDISLDLERRDFTINAIAYNDNSGIVDLFGGVRDIELKKIRCVGNPNKRFNEDGLRILRALRFASVLGFEIEINTKNSIHKNKELLKNISPERLSIEFSKLITGVNFYEIMFEYKDVMAVFIPEILVYDNAVWQHILTSMANIPNNPCFRLAMLLHGVSSAKNSSEIASKVLKNLKYDKLTIEKVKTLILYHDAEIQPTTINVKKWLHQIGKELFIQLLYVKRAYIKSQEPQYVKERLINIDNIEIILEDIFKGDLCYNLEHLAINGLDLIEIGIPEGIQIGELLNVLLNKVIGEELEHNREKLLNYLKNYMKIIK